MYCEKYTSSARLRQIALHVSSSTCRVDAVEPSWSTNTHRSAPLKAQRPATSKHCSFSTSRDSTAMEKTFDSISSRTLFEGKLFGI